MHNVGKTILINVIWYYVKRILLIMEIILEIEKFIEDYWVWMSAHRDSRRNDADGCQLAEPLLYNVKSGRRGGRETKRTDTTSLY